MSSGHDQIHRGCKKLYGSERGGVMEWPGGRKRRRRSRRVRSKVGQVLLGFMVPDTLSGRFLYNVNNKTFNQSCFINYSFSFLFIR